MNEQNARDPQYMDMNYQKWYFVPWPDCQVIDEMEGAEERTVPVCIDGVLGTFVDPEWLFDEEEEEENE